MIKQTFLIFLLSICLNAELVLGQSVFLKSSDIGIRPKNISISNDGRLIAVAGYSILPDSPPSYAIPGKGFVKVIEIKTGNIISIFEKIGIGSFKEIKFADSNNLLGLSFFYGEGVLIWDFSEDKIVFSSTEYSNFRFYDSDKLILSGLNGINLFDLKGKRLSSIEMSGYHLATAPQKGLIASARNNRIEIWDLKNEKIKNECNHIINNEYISREDNGDMSNVPDGQKIVWKTAKPISNILFSPDEQYLISTRIIEELQFIKDDQCGDRPIDISTPMLRYQLEIKWWSTEKFESKYLDNIRFDGSLVEKIPIVFSRNSRFLAIGFPREVMIYDCETRFYRVIPTR